MNVTQIERAAEKWALDPSDPSRIQLQQHYQNVEREFIGIEISCSIRGR